MAASVTYGLIFCTIKTSVLKLQANGTVVGTSVTKIDYFSMNSRMHRFLLFKVICCLYIYILHQVSFLYVSLRVLIYIYPGYIYQRRSQDPNNI